MKRTTIAYWVATDLLALLLSKSAVAYLYLTREAVRVECQRLGFPDYFRVGLAVAQLLGVLAASYLLHHRRQDLAFSQQSQVP